MSDCLFCRIIAGDLPASIVAKDDWTIAIMDLRQSNEGHVLVLPRAHIETIDLLPDDLAGPLMRMTARMTGAVRRAFAPDGVNVWQSNGPGADQEVPHIHMHVFPRWLGDGHFRIYPERVSDMRREGLEALAERIRAAREDGI